MRIITEGLTPQEFILLLNENFAELALIRNVEAFATLVNPTNIELVAAINTYFGSTVVSIGMSSSAFKSAVDNAFAIEAGAKSATIAAWQNAGDLIYVAGYRTSTWEPDAVLSMPENPSVNLNDYTIINRNQAIRQKGYIRSFSVGINYLNPSGGTWAFKIFFWNGTGYQCKSSENFNPVGSGVVGDVQTFILNTPVLIEVGDIPALYVPAKCAASCGASLGYPVPKLTGGNIGVGNADAFTTDVITSVAPRFYGMYLQVNSYRPYAVFLGDSIFGNGAGYQVEIDGREWHTELETTSSADDVYHVPGGKPGDIDLSVPYRVSQHTPPVFKYQNFSKGGSIMSDVVNQQIAKAVAANPKAVIIHCGVNDLLFGAGYPRSWAAISANLDTIRAAFPSGTIFYLDEIMPVTTTSDANSILIRQMNANYAAYCLIHGWALVPCHDEMGTVRLSTGLYDDMNVLYHKGDGLHPNLAGSDKLAEIISRYI